MSAAPVQSPAQTGGPVAERFDSLDILRGVAVGGILLANVIVFFGLFLMDPAAAAALPSAGLDRVLGVLETVLVQGKFYSVFSLLFGIGFGLQLARRGDAALPRFRRRLRLLLLIGVAHALFIWAGDILMLYALLGFTMPWFARRDDRRLLRWVVVLLALPTLLYLVGLVVWLMVAPAPAGDGAAVASGPPAELMAIMNAVGTGGFREAFLGNLLLLAGRWADLLATMRFPKVLGMFVLGLWIARQGIPQRPEAHGAFLRRWRTLGLAGGLAANVLGAWAMARWGYLPPSWGGLLGVAAQAVGVPLLALGYAATVTLLVASGARLLARLAPMGRMALTNYLSHSVVCVVLSYGIGLGLWQRIGLSTAWLIALAIVAVQMPLSAWWMRRHLYGPVEWLWRRFTYGGPLPMRRPSWET